MNRSAEPRKRPDQKANPLDTRPKQTKEQAKELSRLADEAFEEARRDGELLTIDQINELVRKRRAG